MIRREALQTTIGTLAAGIDTRIVGAFLSGMDSDYFETFPPEEIAEHIRLSASLGPGKRVAVRVTPHTSDNAFAIVIAGFDYPSEFSILCGLLTAFGLDIRSGDIFSMAPTGPRRILDVFHVDPKSGAFDEMRQREFAAELETFARLLTESATGEARERLNRFLTERIEGMSGFECKPARSASAIARSMNRWAQPENQMTAGLSGLLSPVEILFLDEPDSRWTVMEVRSQDSFGFLYALANALAMRGMDVHKARIASAGGEALDRFYVADRSGRRIEDPADRQRLRIAAVAMTQFTAFLPEAPDPARAMRHFDHFLDKAAGAEFPDRLMNFLANPRGMHLVAAALGSSDFLWDDFLNLRLHDLLPVLERLVTDPHAARNRNKAVFLDELRVGIAELRDDEERKAFLNRYKDTQLFWIDIQHLVDPETSLMPFSEALTDLAEAVVEEAAAICYADLAKRRTPPPGTYAVCALGKFGGREMGYASDLELLFVYDAAGSPEAPDFYEALVRETVNTIEARDKGIFRIDLRLRPYGDKGPLASSLDRVQQYYHATGEAAPFERQALIKLRRVAGDEALGRNVEAARDRFTYSGAPWDREDAFHLRERQTRELTKRGETHVKYGRGGIVDVEYRVQYLQLIHGGADASLRNTNTLDALGQLQRAGIVEESEYTVLRETYLFLRKLIDALRIVRGDASDLALPDAGSDEFKALARRLGYREPSREEAARHLLSDIRERMKPAAPIGA